MKMKMEHIWLLSFLLLFEIVAVDFDVDEKKIERLRERRMLWFVMMVVRMRVYA